MHNFALFSSSYEKLRLYFRPQSMCFLRIC